MQMHVCKCLLIWAPYCNIVIWRIPMVLIHNHVITKSYSQAKYIKCTMWVWWDCCCFPVDLFLKTTNDNFIRYAIEFWEWKNNFTSHLSGRVITYPCWDTSYVSTFIYIVLRCTLSIYVFKWQLVCKFGILERNFLFISCLYSCWYTLLNFVYYFSPKSIYSEIAFIILSTLIFIRRSLYSFLLRLPCMWHWHM